MVLLRSFVALYNKFSFVTSQLIDMVGLKETIFDFANALE